MAKKPKKATHAFPGLAPQEVKAGLDVKVKLDKSDTGRITVTVTLLQDGVVVAEDYDFVSL